MFLIISCYIADLICGDPEWLPHPVRGMGKFISFLENRLKKSDDKWLNRIKGIALTLIVVGISASLAYLFIELAKKVNPLAGNLAWIYAGYVTLSIKDLRIKAEAISKELKKGAIFEARRQLSKIVGRDTQGLNQEKIVTATVESIAEGTNDGIVAPLFYLILGGPVLAVLYKAVNTLDSMIGYKDEKYMHFGWFSAKLDDAMNFIPARITGFLISISSLKKFKDSFKIMLRDGRKHPSPNSGISEAAMAGALGVELGGPSTYQGKLSEKPYIGEDRTPPRPSLINEALAISFAASLLMVLLGVLFKWVI